MKIDKLLEINGWVRTTPNGCTPWTGYYSTMGCVSSNWHHPKKKTQVVTGLHIKGFPPTLITPIPKHLSSFNENIDAQVNEWLAKSTKEEISNFLNQLL